MRNKMHYDIETALPVCLSKHPQLHSYLALIAEPNAADRLLFPEALHLLQSLLNSACQLPPLTLCLTGLCVLLLLIFLISASFRQLLCSILAKTAGSQVSLATLAQEDYRSHLPEYFPPQKHLFQVPVQGTSTPMACAVCYQAIRRARDCKMCTACGCVVHTSCEHHMHRNCKPLTAPPGSFPVHDWRPAGCTSLLPGEPAVASGGQSAISSIENSNHDDTEEDTFIAEMQPHCCLYCSEPCDVGLIAVEPVLVCSCCHRLAHVQCAIARHPTLFSARTKDMIVGNMQQNGEELHHHRHTNGHVNDHQSNGNGHASTGHQSNKHPKSPDNASKHKEMHADSASAAKHRSHGKDQDKHHPERHSVDVHGAGTTRFRAARSDPGNTMSAPSSPSALMRSRDRVASAFSPVGAGSRYAAYGQSSGSLANHLVDIGIDICRWGPLTRSVLLPQFVMPVQPVQSPPAHTGKDTNSKRRHRKLGQVVASVVEACTSTIHHHSRSHDITVKSASSAAAGTTPAPATKRHSNTHEHDSLNREHSLQDSDVADANHAILGLKDEAKTGLALHASISEVALPPVVEDVPASAASAPQLQTSALVQAAAVVRKKTWPFRRPTETDRWSQYSIAGLPASYRLLLVMVNFSSGPQLGKSLFLQLMQLLHPLQVVELPREDPMAALRFFKSVPNLRILVIGGDGTVAWVLELLDRLAAEEAAAVKAASTSLGGEREGPAGVALPGSHGGVARALTWTPPPVAVLPLGTGNDLARSLGWGGGASARLRHGLAACLREVVTAAHSVPMDRWDVAIRPLVKPERRRSRLRRFLSRRGKLHIRDAHDQHTATGAALSPLPPLPPTSAVYTNHTEEARTPSPPSSHQQLTTMHSASSYSNLNPNPNPSQDGVTAVKVLNNYLGIGIDAKVAYEFHQTRKAYPLWFQSQLGNKAIYTGLGAPDLLRRSCAQLHKKVTLEVDGVPVPIPEDAQGLVVININCHMGGVYLWDNGYPAPPIPVPDQLPNGVNDGEELGRRTAALTANRRTQIADGIIEVCAIGGVAHMGRLAVGLARAQRLAQGRTVSVTTKEELPMQVDGEPWLQEPCRLHVSHKSQALVLRCVRGGPAQRMLAVVSNALESSEASGVITATQRAALAIELGRRLEAVL